MKPKPNPPWMFAAGVVAVLAAIAVGVYVANRGAKPVSTPITSSPTPTPSAPAATDTKKPAIEHPIDEAEVASPADADAKLPALEDSDETAIDALSKIVGGDALSSLVNPHHLIARIVATIDSLPRKKLAENAIPVKGVAGMFATTDDGEHRVIDARNYARYTPYANLAESIDAHKLVSWYVHAYPLFQSAYRELGYPDGYFNDRLVVVIDDLLATPDAPPPVAVTQPNVVYEYADPALESLSAGQKLLIRTGPDNAAIIKAKLREIRAALTGAAMPRDDAIEHHEPATGAG